MKIVVLAAMPEEFRAVAASLDNVSTTRIGQLKCCRGQAMGHDLTVVEIGMGFNNAARATTMVSAELSPDLLVSAGFCGGIAQNLLVGDVVVARELLIVANGAVEQVNIDIPDISHTFVARQANAGKRIFGGLFAGTPVIMDKAELTRLLPPNAPNAVVEMESAAIAIVAAESGVPLIAIRSVSDPFDEELGFSLDEFCDQQMRIRPTRVMLTILRKPRIIPQLIRLARNSRIAAASLAVAFKELLPLL